MTAKLDNTTKEQSIASKPIVDAELVEKAVCAVLKFQEKIGKESCGKLSLLGNERPLHIQFTLFRAPGRRTPKPFQIVIPHPFFKVANGSNRGEDETEEPEICLIVKDSAKPGCQEMIANFPDHMGSVKKVLTLDSLRRKYTSYEQKRELLHKYNMFMADDRILPMLSKALGKAFIQTKRLPVPINLTREKALPFAIQKALSATYMTVSTGTCITIRAGHTGMTVKRLVENCLTIIDNAVPKMPRSWTNIQLISIKTADSVSLPVYNKTPEALLEIARMAGIKNEVPKDVTSQVGTKDANNEKVSRSSKTKRSLKSPLLKALKKQKRESTVDPGTKSPTESLKADRKVSKINDNTLLKEGAIPLNPSTEKNVSDSKSQTKNVRSKNVGKEQKQENKEEKVDQSSSTEFIRAKIFKGSKKGYVFKMGSQGLGYYVDVPPRIDRASMDAVLALGKNKNRRGGQKKNKYKGTRRF